MANELSLFALPEVEDDFKAQKLRHYVEDEIFKDVDITLYIRLRQHQHLVEQSLKKRL